jgi:uracil-xanthine permease
MANGEKYDYRSLCIPSFPWNANKPPVQFYGKDDPIPAVIALIMGLQHAFAMIGGLITPPLVVFKFAVCGFPFCPDLQQYAISAALITSGICTIINILQFKIPGTKFVIGSGVLSVMGTSFTFLPIFEIAIAQMKADNIDGNVAYGKMLGTSMVCALLELFLSVMPIKALKKAFPPIVTSVTVILIGVALTGTGMKYLGGGVVCAEMVWKNHSQVLESDVSFGPPFPSCTAGETSLGYGASEYVGLGASVMVFLVFIELFGSVFMKNCNVILALLFGYFVAGVSRYEDSEGNALKFVLGDNIANADPIAFLWTTTFPLGFYAPAVAPLLIAYLVTTVETVGDINAVYEVSGLELESDEHEKSIQGGLTSDAFNSILSSLCTSMPNTTFSQNNGVIALTKCASKRAGYACGFWLILMGIFGKVAGLITSIPDCVIGGMTIFLFANVLVSGITLANRCDLQSRRTRFIFALSLACGVGVTVWPYAFQDLRGSSYTAAFWTCAKCSNSMKGVRNGVSIFLSTGYCIGTVVAMILNSILPEDTPVSSINEEKAPKEEGFGDDLELEDEKVEEA